MNISQTMSRIGAALGTIGSIVVLAASAQAATSKPVGMSQSEYRALMIRSGALNKLHGNAVTRLSSGQFKALYRAGANRLAPQEFAALVARSAALNRHYGLDGTSRATKADAPAADYPAEPTAIERLVRQEDARGTASASTSEYPAEPTAIDRLVRQEDARRNDLQLGITRPTQVVPAPISPRIEVVASDGFDWLDAALGAASAVGIAGALGGAVLVVRGRTPRQA